jgi:hypothetical protein
MKIGVAAGILAVCLAGAHALAAENPFFSPSQAQLEMWVQRGFALAEKDKPVFSDTRVGQCVWMKEPSGLLVDQTMATRMVVLLSPEYICTLAGWAAAWDEAKWKDIQADPVAEARALARTYADSARRGRLWVGLAVERAPSARRTPYCWVFGGGRWYTVHLDRGRPYLEAADRREPEAPFPQWAWECTLGIGVQEGALARPEAITVYVGWIDQHEAPPTHRLLQWIGGLQLLRAEDIRVTFSGTGQTAGFLDLTIYP